MRLDGSEIPIAVSFVAGDFFYRNRTNKKLLSYLGDLCQLAEIPAGKAAGAWARSIGRALLQHWRNYASTAEVTHVGDDSHLTARVPAISRRDLFQMIAPHPDPFGILQGNDPRRAISYWDDAIAILRNEQFSIAIGPSKLVLPRQGWQDEWLDEPLDLRPHRDNILAIQAVREISDGARDYKKNRARRKKKS